MASLISQNGRRSCRCRLQDHHAAQNQNGGLGQLQPLVRRCYGEVKECFGHGFSSSIISLAPMPMAPLINRTGSAAISDQDTPGKTEIERYSECHVPNSP